MKVQGIAYFLDTWNYLQLILFIVFTTFFIRRWQLPSMNILPNDVKNEKKESWKLIFWCGSNTFILIMSAFYVMFYARVYESFGMFIKLCKETLAGIKNFMIFLVFWICIFAYLFKIIGSDVYYDTSKDDYQDLEENSQ